VILKNLYIKKEEMYSINKKKKFLNSIIINRNVRRERIFVITSVQKKKLELNIIKSYRLTKSALFQKVSDDFFLEKKYITKVENYILGLKSTLDFNSIVLTKKLISNLVVYYKNNIIKMRAVLIQNSLFFQLILIKLNLILIKK